MHSCSYWKGLASYTKIFETLRQFIFFGICAVVAWLKNVINI